MRNITKLFCGVFIFTLMSTNSFAQDGASVTWPCTAESRIDVGDDTSPSLPTIVGNLEATNEASGNVNWRIRSYSGTANGSGAYQRWWPNDGTNPISWGDETGEVADRYVEFTVSPTSGNTFSVDSIRMDLLGGGTSNIRANVYYSTDGFTSRTNLNDDPVSGISLPNSGSSDIMPLSYATSIEVGDGNTLSLRIYCWYTGSASTSKYLYVHNVVIYGTTSATVIPVELTSFSASVSGKAVTLNWATATELNNRGFEIQRKFGNGGFEAVTFIKGKGTTTKRTEYQYVDQSVAKGLNTYRLKQVDLNGSFSYSKEIEVNIGLTPLTFNVEQNYPNPFNPNTTIRFTLAQNGPVSLSVYNVVGEQVRSIINNETKEAGTYNINFDASELPSGLYIYTLRQGQQVASKKMILIHLILQLHY